MCVFERLLKTTLLGLNEADAINTLLYFNFNEIKMSQKRKVRPVELSVVRTSNIDQTLLIQLERL